MADASPVTSPRPIGAWGSVRIWVLESLSYAERQACRSVFGLTVRLQIRGHGRGHGQINVREQYIKLERQKVE